MSLIFLLLSLTSFADDPPPKPVVDPDPKVEVPKPKPKPKPKPQAKPKPQVQPRQTPVVQLKAKKEQRFSVILDGRHAGLATFEVPLLLTEIKPGQPTVEIRNEDNTVIWSRGVLDLKPTEELILSLSEGRPVLPTGRPGAWRASNTPKAPPNKPVKKPLQEAP